MENCIDLNIGKGLCIFTYFHQSQIVDSLLILLDGVWFLKK